MRSQFPKKVKILTKGKINMNKKWRTLLIMILGVSMAACYGQQKDGKNMSVLDSKEWQTYCTGRYLIDLPSALNPEYAGGDSLGGTNIVWEKQFTNRKQLLARVEQMKTNLKNLRQIDDFRGKDDKYYKLRPREDGSPYLVKQIEYPNGGVGLLVRTTPYRSAKGYALYSFFITEKPFRVFSYTLDPIFDDNMEAVLKRNQEIALSLRSREINEIPKGAGLCIYGGFISGSQSKLGESGSIKLNYPYYSKDYYFQIGIGNIVVSQPMTVHPKKKKSSTPKIIKVFRDSSDKTVAGLKGMEYAMIRQNEDDPKIPLYNFTWHYPGTANSSQDPHVAIYMSYVERGISPIHARVFPEYVQFANSNDALALWDRVLNSVRRRPE